MLGLATLIVCNLIPDSLGKMFFSRNDLGNYIRIASFSMPILFTAMTMYGILNGLNKQGVILKNSLIVSGLELICLFVLVGNNAINIMGYGITIFITSCVSLYLNLREVKKHIDLNLSKANIFIFLLLSILIFLTLRVITHTLLANYFIFKNLVIITITFATFIILSFFGIEEEWWELTYIESMN